MIRPIKALTRWSQRRVDFFGAQNQFFGGFIIFNYIVPYFLWYEPGINGDNALRLRFLGGVLCGGIIARDYWFSRLRPYFSLYWHFSLAYCLLFYNFYMFMDSDGSPFWLAQISLGLFVLAVLVDWYAFAVLLTFGVSVGIGAYCLIFGLNAIHMGLQTLFLPIYLCLMALVMSRFYQFVAKEEAHKQTQYFLAVANQIASILRVSYYQMMPGLFSLKKHFPILLHAYERAEKANLLSVKLDAHEFDVIRDLPDDFARAMDKAEEAVRMEVGKFQKLPSLGQRCELKVFSISAAVEEVLDMHQFADGLKSLVNWQGGTDFDIKANKDLFVHMLLNLISNSFDQITLHGRGHISVWLEKKGSKNCLYFKDTAGGVSAEEAPFLFDAFYSNTPGRVGFGLTFCKRVMTLFHGKLACKAITDKQITFRLSFPKVYDSGTREEKMVEDGGLTQKAA